MSEITDVCFACGCYVPEGRQICAACEGESALKDMDKTPDGVIRRWRPAIIRAARSLPSKQADMQAIQELGLIGLAYYLGIVTENKHPETLFKAPLIRAIAETRVLVERLALIHCVSAEDADAYRFYLEQAARAADPNRRATR